MVFEQGEKGGVVLAGLMVLLVVGGDVVVAKVRPWARVGPIVHDFCFLLVRRQVYKRGDEVMLDG